MRSLGQAQSNMSGVLLKRGNWTDTQGGHLDRDWVMAVSTSQECQDASQLPEARGEVWSRISHRPQKGLILLRPVPLDFQPQELRESKCLLF